MAAKPIERFVKKQIAEQGGYEHVLRRIASGESIADIARTLYRPDGKAIDRSTLAHILHRDPERSAQVYAARKEGASAMVDEALRLVDEAPLERDAIQKARVQSDLRVRVAGLIDRESFGPAGQQVNVQVNVETMHLDSLRHRMVEASVPLAASLAVSRAAEIGDGSAGHIDAAHVFRASDTKAEATVSAKDSDS